MPIPHLEVRGWFLLAAAASAWLCAAMPVFSQEAYYWTYAQHPDLAYFDHPPMVAWLIWIGTSLFGDGAIGIRFGTWCCGIGTLGLGLRLLTEFGASERSRVLWIVLMMGSPLLVVSRVLTNPDPPLVLAATAALYAVWRARDGNWRWWLLVGGAGGFGLLSKYTAAFLGLSTVLAMLVDPDLRRHVRRPGPYLAVVVALVVFSPVIVWNATNDFESFRFQTSQRLAKGDLGIRWFAELVGGQVGLLNPLLAATVVVACGWLLRQCRTDPRGRLLLAFGLPLPIYMVTQSLWIQIKLNWLVPAYVPLLLGTILWAESTHRFARFGGLWRWTLASALMLQLLLPLAPLVRLLPPGRGSSWTGWDAIAHHAEIWEDRVDPEDGVEGNFFFFAADYRDAAQFGRSMLLLRRAEEGVEHPEEADFGFEPTLAQNVFGRKALQYDHWNPPAARLGQDALFVLPRPDQRSEVVAEARRCFRSMERVKTVHVEELGVRLFDADLFLCRDYLGPVGH